MPVPRTATRTAVWQMLPWAAAASLLGACGGSAEQLDAPASNAPCAVSALCPDGERCDDGHCVADVVCPAPVPPRSLGVVVGAPQLAPSLIRVGLHQYLVETAPDALSDEDIGLATRVRFSDLVDGSQSDLVHEVGATYCNSEPLYCIVRGGDGATTILTGIAQPSVGGPWLAEATYPSVVPPDYWIFGGPAAPSQLWLYRVGFFDRLTVETGAIEPWVDLEGRSPLIFMYPATAARPEGVMTMVNTVEHVDLHFAPLTQGAKPIPLPLLDVGIRSWLYPVAWGDNWIFVRNKAASDGFYTTKLVNGVLEPGGMTEDEAIRAVAERFLVGKPSIGEGIGSGVHCVEDQCRLVRADLRDATVTTLATADVPGSGWLDRYGERWLACGGVDVVVSRGEFAEGKPTKRELWTLRLLPE